MPWYTTKIRALDPEDGEMKTWCGPNIEAISWGMAKQYCDLNGLGYCEIDGQLVSEIPCFPGTRKADWSKEINYQTPGLN